jgi:hypothetical protein
METATADQCELCGKDLRDKKPLSSRNERLIEDIPDPVEETEVVKISQEKTLSSCHHGEIATGVAGRGYRAQCQRLNLLPVERAVFALYKDKGLSQRIFWISALHGEFGKPCHDRVRTHERGL